MKLEFPSLPEHVVKSFRQVESSLRLDVAGGRARRTSSRFCFGVEHGDYNGTELFGVGTDRFIWMAYKPNTIGRLRLFSTNFPEDGVIDFELSDSQSCDVNSWSRFPMGVNAILQSEGYRLTTGLDAIVMGNIPGGGMSRSASLTLNLVMTLLEINRINGLDGMRIVELAQAVENDYIGSPCGNLDQIMIYFAKAGMGTHYIPHSKSIEHIPLGQSAEEFRIVSLDTGTERPGLEKSTYKLRRKECDQLVELARAHFNIDCLGDVRSVKQFHAIMNHFGESHPQHCRRLKYVFEAQRRFPQMLDAWTTGDICRLGEIFRLDGHGLRDDYEISGPELEAMCDIARTVEGVFGERMLGGGDKGASGALIQADAIDTLRATLERDYSAMFPHLATRFAVHACQMVDGIVEMNGLKYR